MDKSQVLRNNAHEFFWASYLLEYDIIFIGIWHHIYWNVALYLLEYVIIFIGMWHYIYWNMSSYLLEYGIIFIGIWHHIYWNIASYLLEYGSIFIGMWHHICLLLNNNSDKNYILNITSVQFLGGISPNNSKNIDI